MDEVRLWSRPLEQGEESAFSITYNIVAEIIANMHAHLRGDEPDLVAYWNFDDTDPGVTFDRSVYGAHMLLGGGTEGYSPQRVLTVTSTHAISESRNFLFYGDTLYV